VPRKNISLLPRLHSGVVAGAANGGGRIRCRGAEQDARRTSACLVSVQIPAVGLIALMVGASLAYQHSSALPPNGVSAQVSEDDHRLAGQLDEEYGCYVNTTVDGVPFRMLVDTGSDDLAFNSSHLQKLGLNPKRLKYSKSISTSNGIIRSAPIRVHELRIGAFVLHDVPATVDFAAGSDEPLLGMSVIKYMHLEMDRHGCELRW
jgi:clan AA aspartic protease (TIGR02281 family)